MPGNIGWTGAVVIILVLLLVFGPKRLPEMGRSLGRGMREFKDSISGNDRDEDLEEFRSRLVISLIALGAAFTATYILRKPILEWLKAPLPADQQDHLITLDPLEAFTTSFMVALYGAIAIALPILLWQLWSFLAPAFEETSQRVVARLVAVATALFAGGMAFAYWVVLPAAIPFLLNFDSDVYQNEIRARPYFSFAATTIFACGLLFELPVFILGLVRLGILSANTLRHNRRIGFGMCIIAAVLLPGVDILTTALQAGA